MLAVIFLLINCNYSFFQIVQAPYAIAAYATRLAIGLKIKNATPAPISIAPSSVVRSLNLSIIHFLIIVGLLVVNTYP